MLRLPRDRRSSSPAARPSVRVVAPTQDDVWLSGTAERQNLLAQCDRSPSIFRLTLASDPAASASGRPRHGASDEVAVLDRDGRQVGMIPPALAGSYARRLRRLHRHGIEIAVHGQVVRCELDLCVVLHCTAPNLWAQRWT